MSDLDFRRMKNPDNGESLGTNYLINGTAKAWANINGSGTIAVRDSLNITGVTDNGTGDYTFVFSNSMLDPNFIFMGSGGSGASGGISDIDVSRIDQTVTGGRFEVVRGSSNTVTDFAIVQVMAMGNLA